MYGQYGTVSLLFLKNLTHVIYLLSFCFSVRGNEMAQLSRYTTAIELFSEAITLDPADFRFFGNRSYCYDRITQYEK